MPRRREATKADVEQFNAFRKTRLTVEQFEESKRRGDKVEFEESLFSDPGDDYTALYVNGTRVGHWSGY
jgi:hypothetical protein